MAMKQYRPWLPGQPTLLPTDLNRWLPDEHLAWFILEIVGRLDLTPIETRLQAKDPRGMQPYDPRMMMALLMYAYAVGVFSSRRIERATYEDVAFRVLTADQHPDHFTIARFRRDNLDLFRDLFVQVLRIAASMGLVKFGVLGLDGTKILANASKHQAMSYDRMKKEIARLKEEIGHLAERAEQADQEDQARFGDGRVADIPAEIARREERKARIEEAMAALEAEARAARVGELREQKERHEQNAEDPSRSATERKRSATLARKRAESVDHLLGDPPTTDEPEAPGERDDHDDDVPPASGGAETALPSHAPAHDTQGRPRDEAQRNFTDPESRIMVRDGDHVVQAYNAQAVVDHAHQIVVGAAVGNQPPDCEYLEPMLDRVESNLASAGISRPAKTPLAADTGYFSEDNVAACEAKSFDPYIAPERQRRRRPELVPVSPPAPADGPPGATAGPPAEPTPKEKMRAKLKTEEGARIYGLRKTTPEPVFGQILEVRGFRRFMLRGLWKVRGEWDLVTLTHNLLKMWRSGAVMAPAV